DPAEAGTPQQRPIAVERLEGRRRHPLPEPLALAIAQTRKRDPVAEGEPAAGNEHPVALGEHRRLVGDVQKRLLAHARVEGATGEGQGRRVGADDTYARLLYQAVEAGGAAPPRRGGRGARA